ncbi:MAG: VanZ family protein [Planctomycetes bacterium]|nr:VanZ family protein [Planctomycetota bacterium]
MNAWLWRLTSSTAVLAWMGLIFYLSSLSQSEVSRPLESPAISWLGVLRSYAAHVVLYGVLACLLQASLWRWKPDYRPRWLFAAAAFAALYGISDEYHQSFVMGRYASIFDVVVNALGAVAASASLWLGATWWRGHAGR